jgi:hypothetical protein
MIQVIFMELRPWKVSARKGILYILRNSGVHYHDHNSQHARLSYGEVLVAQPWTLSLEDHPFFASPRLCIHYIVADLLRPLSYLARKKPLLGKHIPNADNDRTIAVSITIEENDHC